MKIVFIIRSPYGMMGTNASYMLPHYIAEEHEVTVICPKPTEKEKELIVFYDERLKIIQITNENVFARASEASIHIKDIAPDIVHLFSHPKCILYPMLYKIWQRGSKIKWYLDIRAHIFSMAKLNLFKEGLINTIFQFYFDVITATASESYTSYILFPLRKFIWSPIGTDLKEFKEVPNKVVTKKKFIFIGSIAKVRRLDILVEGFGKFLDEVKDPDYFLDFYGGGNSEEELKDLVKREGWSEQINFLGTLPFKELTKKIVKYDAGFVFLPKDKFCYSPALKRLEYAAAKIDILESDTKWNLENPEGFKTFHFDNTPESIRNCIINYIKTETSKESIEHNYEKVKRFDWKNIYENDVKPLYNNLMKR